MMKRRLVAATIMLSLVTGLSCDKLTAPPTTGGIDVVLLSATGIQLRVGPRPNEAGNVDLSILSADNTANVMLDGVRVTVTGPTTKTVTVSTANGGFTQLSVDGLAPGSYSVTVEGLVGSRVGRYGERTNLSVRAGNNARALVSFPVFQPEVPIATSIDTAKVLRFPVTFTAVANATSYTVEWSTSPTMADAQNKTVTTTSTDVNVAAEGTYYYTVRAVNSAVATAGLPSVPKTVEVFQAVATVAVSPAAPTLTAGATQQFTFVARDADNVIVTNPPVLWVSSNHTVATISPTGLATTITSGTAVISAVAKGTPGTATLTANPMAPTKLVFTTQPANTTAGQSMASIQVAIQNPQNQTASTDNTTQVTIAFGTNAGSGTLGGTKTVTVANGVASFTTLNVDRTGTGYTLTATSGTLTAATSTGFNITPAGASALAFIVQPSTVTAGSPMSPAVQVEVQDALGNRAIGANGAITVAIGTNPSSGTLSGTTVVNAINGVASFSGLSINRNGNGYTLAASSASLTGATSAAFNISAATQLAFSIAPASAVAGAALSPALQVEIRDATGNRVTSANDAVTIAFGANPGSGTLSGTTVANAVNGIATFSGISINKAATGYTLTASSGGLTVATSPTFTISAAAVSRVGFTVEPNTITSDETIVVTVTTQDAFGNLVPTSTDIAVTIGNNPSGGSLTGTTTLSITDGIAVFNDLHIGRVGVGYTLVATSATLISSVASNPFGISVGAAAKLGILTQPATAEPGGIMDSVEVAVLDAAGNQRDDAIDITIAVGNNPSNGALTGLLTVTSVDGVAKFLDLAIDSTGTGYTLAATGGGLTQVTTDPFAVSLEFVEVSTGDLQACGITTRQSAYCWGVNPVGGVGDGTNIVRPQPQLVVGGKFIAVASGWAFGCGIRTDSLAVCWGHNSDGQVGMGSTLGPIAGSGQPPTLVTGGHKFFAISAGTQHACAIRAVDSLAFCWGEQQFGRLGNGDDITADVPNPTPVNGAHMFKSISAGEAHTCGVRADGTGMCWGRQLNGRLGNALVVEASVTAPAAIAGLTFLAISAGEAHTCGIQAPASDRRGYCWGANGSGQLGIVIGADVGSPTEVSNSLRYSGIRASGTSACAVTTGGVGVCWGSATGGRLGNGTMTGTFASPQAVLGGLSFLNISAGQPGNSSNGPFACGLATSGVYCWGSPVTGLLGDGGTIPSSVPVRVRGQR